MHLTSLWLHILVKLSDFISSAAMLNCLKSCIWKLQIISVTFSMKKDIIVLQCGYIFENWLFELKCFGSIFHNIAYFYIHMIYKVYIYKYIYIYDVCFDILFLSQNSYLRTIYILYAL